MSAYYHICPHCGASLDPGELCDCMERLKEYAEDCPLDATPCTGDCPDSTCPRHL